MTTIKNFEGFKKSLLLATNGIMEYSLDDSTMFSKQEYESYRIYVDNGHYFNMFVIHNVSNNTYDVAFETSCCGISTMSRSIKTQKSLIERVVRWIHNNYLNVEIISIDSEDYTDKCEETTHTPTLDFEYCNLMYTDEYKAAHGTPSTQEDELDRVKYLMETHSFPSTAYKRHSYKEVDKVCGDCSHFNACMQGYQTIAPTCCMFDSLYRARKNPNWHYVSLATLANIDFDMLDEKRQTYFTAFRDLQKTLSYLRKCKTESSYYACFNRYLKKRDLYANKISANMFRYTSTKLSMQNVESGVWASECEEATGYHESRRYNKSRVGK